MLLHTDKLVPPLEVGKIGFERFKEKEMDHAEGDRRINEGKRGGCRERMATILEQ